MWSNVWAHYWSHSKYMLPKGNKDASDDACGTPLSQEHNDHELPVAFLLHIHRPQMEKEHY